MTGTMAADYASVFDSFMSKPPRCTYGREHQSVRTLIADAPGWVRYSCKRCGYTVDMSFDCEARMEALL